MQSLPAAAVLAAVLATLIAAHLTSAGFIGVNYGAQYSTGANTVTPEAIVALLRRQSITHLRLIDGAANSGPLLRALARTGIEVMITLPNTELMGVASSNATAAAWVADNVLPYLPATNITAVCVGTEVLTSQPYAAPLLVPAMYSIRAALSATNFSANIRVTTSHDPALLLDSFPPSQAYFNKSFSSVILPLLDFLSRTSSFFMLNVFSYDIYKAGNGIILLDYALLNPVATSQTVVDSNTLFQYRNLFDAILDAAFFALAKVNHSDVPITVSATGWPSSGDINDDPDATPDHASAYNSNLIYHILSNAGTPRRPNATINAYLFELFNEDLRVGSPADRNYGLFNASATGFAPVYLLRLSGSGPLLANDTASQLFCVSKSGVDPDALQIALDWVCGIGRANCSALQPGQLCYEPDTVEAHASYAFDSFYQNNDRLPGSCDFNGVATISTTNPSTGTCIFPGSLNKTSISSIAGSGNSTFMGDANITTAAPSASIKSSALPLLTYDYSLLSFAIAISLLYHPWN